MRQRVRGHAALSVEVLVGVRIVKCHAIVDVLCYAIIRVVIGVHVLLLPPLLFSTLCLNSHTVLVHPTLSRSQSFSYVFQCILTTFEGVIFTSLVQSRRRHSRARLPVLSNQTRFQLEELSNSHWRTPTDTK